MFDIGFTEMMVIGIVALVVIGPKQLPLVARQAGKWITKMRRYVEDVKADFSKQAELDELRKIKDEFKGATDDLSTSFKTTVNETQSEFDALSQTLTTPPGSEPESPTDWDQIWAARRTRDKIKERRKERSKELGLVRSKFRR